MNPIERFQAYLKSLENRLRVKAWTAGLAAIALAAFVGTLGGAWLADRYAFSDTSLFWARLTLFFCVSFALVFGLIVPWLRVNHRRAAAEAESKFPGFEQRLHTLVQDENSNPFHALLAEEALERAEQFPPSRLVEPRTILGLSLAGAIGAGALMWLTVAAPGPLGHGAALLWAGARNDADDAYYRILIQPGDRKVRRGSDQIVEAQLVGFDSPEVRLLARPVGASKWEVAPMEPKEGVAGAYGFLLAGLVDSMEYRVEAGRVRSVAHKLTVVDLPSVKNIRVTYNFPSWMGMRPVVEKQGGDLRAVEGTVAQLLIETDRPLPDGLAILDDASRLPLANQSPATATVKIPIQKDGMYHIAAIDGGEPVRISDDFFIEARPETPPVVKIIRPGRDARVSPIEEVPIEVEATDDFGLQDVLLHYSVNGGEEKTVPLLKNKGTREGRGSALITLEDFRLEPGDLVAAYATARDARATTRTEMLFIEAQPFEKEFSQSQTPGGGGAMEGGNQPQRISDRQKEIISATWNEIRSRKAAGALREDAEFLSGVQKKLSDQALSLAKRMQSRELSGTNEEFKTFSKEMELASQAMTAAVDQLKAMKWREALSPEQKALQHLLRAEAVFKQIQVAFGQRGGGGSGGGGGESRDLESLFDLELDTEKNQYETADRGNQQSQREKEVDEAVKRLEELARRQQQLADQQRQNRQQSFQQRWAQEMLRREAEELRRQMEQISRGSSQQQSGSQSQQGQQGRQSQQGQAQSGQQQGQQGQQSASSQGGGQGQGQSQPGQRSLRDMASGRQQSDPKLERALQQVERALDDMRKSQQQGRQSSANPDDARRAADRLNEAQNLLGGMRRQETGTQMDAIAGQARQLADRQRDFEKRLRQSYGNPTNGRPQPGQPQPSREQAEKFATEKSDLLRDYQRLERDLKDATRSMASSERAAASRLRDALGEAQQNELGLRMKYSADWIRRGMGSYMAPRERVVTEALDKLQQQVEQAQQAMGKQSGAGQEKAEQALEQLERARGALSRQFGQQPGQQQGQQGQRGRQPGQQGQQGGQQGRQGQQGQGEQGQGQRAEGGRSGEQPGGGRPQGGSGGQTREEYGALNDGSLRGPEGGNPLEGGRRGMDARAAEQAYNDALRQLEQLRSSGAANDELQKEIESLLDRMRRLDPKRFPGNPQLLEALRRNILPGLEQIELKLRRDLGVGGMDARTAAPPRVPPGYEKSVAEYFKRLSKGN